jgi:hypothetical protein
MSPSMHSQGMSRKSPRHFVQTVTDATQCAPGLEIRAEGRRARLVGMWWHRDLLGWWRLSLYLLHRIEAGYSKAKSLQMIDIT